MHGERRTNLAGGLTNSQANRNASAQGRRSTAARWGARALLAGVLVLLAGAHTAQAIVLVSNIGQTGAGEVSFSSVDAAQRFTTGSNPVGYILESFDLRLSVPSGTAFPTVTLHSGSARGHVVRTAVAPTTASSGFTNYRYTLDPPVHLPRSRDYWIKVSGPDGTQWTRTATLTENDASRKGWEIHDKRETRNSGSNNAFTEASADESMLLAVNGYAYNPGRTPPSCLPAEPDQVWCADITAAADIAGLGWQSPLLGSELGSVYGKSTFRHAGATVEVIGLVEVSQGNRIGTLALSMRNIDGGSQILDDATSFTLKVDGQEVSFTDAVSLATSNVHGNYFQHHWAAEDHSVTLTDKETYTVRLLRSNNEPPQIASVTRANPRDLPWFDAEYTDADTLSWEVRFTERLQRNTLDAGDFHIAGSTATVTSVTLDRDGTLARVTAGGGNLADYNGTVTLELASGQNIMDLAGNTLTDTSIRHAPRENSYEVQNYAPASNYLVSNTSRHSPEAAGGFSDYDHAQGFRTGGNADGYTLSSVAIKMNTYSANKYPTRTTAPTVWVVKGSPGETTGRITLTAPTLKRDRRRYLVEYTDPANTTLAPNTDYYVVITGGVAGHMGYPNIEIIDSGDVTARSGWSLHGSYQYRQLRARWAPDPRPWSSRRGTWALQMEVRGEAASQAQAADPPAVQGTPVLSGAGDDGTWSEGETVRVDLTFSEAVDVDTSEGTPLLGIELGDGGSATRSAEYESGSGTTTLTFAYTLVAGDGAHTSMAVTPDSLALGGGTIRSSETGFDALLAHVGAAAMGRNSRNAGPQASFRNAPQHHDGESPFKVELRFSGTPAGLDAKRDAGSVLEVTGGSVTRARSTGKGANPVWEVTVTPNGPGAVEIRLPNRACNEANAVCIGGEPLSRTAEATVPGPQATPTVSIAAPATSPVTEGTALVFTLSRTQATGRTLAVNVTVSETGDVLGEAPPTSVTFAAGASTATLRVATADDETHEDASTVTATLAAGSGYVVDADAGAAEGRVESDDLAPLTARFTKTPDGHVGTGTFLLRFAFSHEPVGYSYKTVRDHLFDVTGGTIEKARRLVKRSNVGWELRVAPDGLGDVTLSARATTDCGADYAACDAAGRKFDGELATTIAGPVQVSVADASVDEAEGATLDFAVTLSRAATQSVSVAYETSDGEARAGDDYTDTSGTLTFAAGETAKTIHVAVSDDAHDEGAETMTLTLSSPTGAVLGDATATGTIENHDPMPRAWAVRFGRTVGSQVLDALESRFAGGHATHLTVGGMRFDALGANPVDADEDARAAPVWAESRREPDAFTPNARDLLLGTSFHLSSAADARDGPDLTAWGHVATGRFETEEDSVTMDGDVTTGIVGLDAEWDRLIAGLMLSYSEGDGAYRLDPEHGDDAGTVASTMAGVYPYARMELDARVSAWALAGAGSGEITIRQEGRAEMPTDLSMRMGAIGVDGELLDGSGRSGVRANVRSDAMWVSTKTEDTDELAETEGDATRVRLILEGSRTFGGGSGASFTPKAEIALRHDGGDAETGTGVEVGAGLEYRFGALSVEGRVRRLVAHEASGYEEWGASGSVRLDPDPSGTGLTLAVTPQWGRTASASGLLWDARDARALARSGEFDPSGRVAVEAGYGLRLGPGRSLLTPYAAMSLGEGSGRTMRGGARWDIGHDVTVGVEATRSESGRADGENDVRARASVRF